jgi:hypothetical protein
MGKPRDVEVRCIACFTRFRIKEGVKKAKCPGCGIVWRIPLPCDGGAGGRGADREICPTGDKI